MVALCRAKGIPARSVYGYVTNYYNTTRHAWVEVYSKKYGWVPFDPTPNSHNTFNSLSYYTYLYMSRVKYDKYMKGPAYYNADYYYESCGDPIRVDSKITFY